MFKNTLIVIFFFCFGLCHAQTTASIKEIKDDYQTCLDNADYMVGCAYDYYNKADSLLHVVYNKIALRLKPSQREEFRKEQAKWLKKREAYFKKVRKQILKEQEGLIGDDQKMMVADEQAEFIFERVEALLKRL